MHICFLELDIHAHTDARHNDIHSFEYEEIQHSQLLMDSQLS